MNLDSNVIFESTDTKIVDETKEISPTPIQENDALLKETQNEIDKMAEEAKENEEKNEEIDFLQVFSLKVNKD